MVQKNGKRENQHYVPQFLLRNFAFHKRGSKKKDEQQIYVFDKRTDKSFISNVSDITSEKGFYDFYVGEEEHSMEPLLSELETNASAAIQKLIIEENLTCLDDEDRVWLSIFVAIQYLRVKKQREVIKDLTDKMEQHIVEMGFDPAEVEGFERLSAEDIKMMTLESFSSDVQAYAGLLANKTLLLLKYPDNHSLYISDNPVVLHNDNDFRPYGNIGFAVRGIQIYFPISKNLALAFWCVSIQEEFEEGIKNAEKKIQQMKAYALLSQNFDKDLHAQNMEDVKAQYDYLLARKDAGIKGVAFLCSGDNATFLNSLQVKWSHRHVLSYDGNFDLVKKMISDNEKHREGVKISFG